MPADPVRALISYIGLLVQLGGSALLVVLFALMRRSVIRRQYARVWGWAWVAVLVALVALVLRAQLLAASDAPQAVASGHTERLLYLVYQFAKILYYALLVGGTLVYAKGLRARRALWRVVPAAALFAAITATATRGIDAVVVWQAPVAVAALVFCAATLFCLPRSRRSAGNSAMAAVFATTALVWAVYLVALGLVLWRDVILPPPIAWLLVGNSFVDAFLQLLLGYGMIVMLLEDAKREVDDAHAELRVAHSRLLRESLYDALTGALNRRAFAEGVGLESAKATFGTVIVADLDDLKRINDSHGHLVGDAVLQRLADTVRDCLRQADHIFRWGGDEFLLVLPGAKPEDVLPRLERRIAAAAQVEAPGAPVGIPLRVSLGASVYAGGEELPAAIGRADREMYAAKSNRKTGVRSPPAVPNSTTPAVVA